MIRNDVRVVDMNLTEMVKQEHDRLIVSISCQKSPDIEEFYPKWWTSVYKRDRSLDVKNKYKLLAVLITDADDTSIIFAIHVESQTLVIFHKEGVALEPFVETVGPAF